jgi:dihydroflavonol-4-reductase
MEKVFLTGPDGMLGSSICRELLKQGYDVRALCLPDRKNKNIRGLPVEYVTGNILDSEKLERVMKGCQVVVHCAARVSVWPRRDPLINLVNIDGTRNVMRAAENTGVQKMIHIGSASSFGFGSMEHPGDENSVYNGWTYGMDYLDSKYFAQKLLLERHRETGFPVVIIAPTYMIGPYDSAPSSGKVLISLYNGSMKYFGKGGKNFVCSTDVARATVNAIWKGRTGECYISGNQNLSYGEFFSRAFGILGMEKGLQKAPDILVLGAGLVSSVMARIGGIPPKFSYGMARISQAEQYFSPAKARLELGMPQTPIDDGIRQCFQWFRENQYIA